MFTPEKNIFSILGQAFPVYGKSVKYLAVITLMAFVPVFIFIEFIPQAYVEASRNLFDTWFEYIFTYNYVPEILAVVPEATLTNAATYFLISFAIELAFFPISVAAATYLVFKHLKEEEPTFGGMFTAALPILPKMMVTSAIAFAIIYMLLSLALNFLGGLLLFIAIYFIVGMVFYQHIVADVGRWGFNAISLSRFIVRGRWFRTFFGIIIIFTCYGLLSWTTERTGLILGVGSSPFLHLPYFLLQHFLLSYFAIVFALWYFDIKRFHTLNFQEMEKEIKERIRQHIDKFGENAEEDKEDKEDEGK